MILDKEHLRANLDEVIWNIEQARITVSEHHIVKLVTVAKYTELENISTLYELGQRAFGENQVQQLKERMDAIEDLPLEWHMIGSLQKNKINNLIELRPTLMQSLDSIALATELNKKLLAKETKMNCLLQVNAANEEAIQAFQDEKCSFFGMSEMVLDAYKKFEDVKASNIEEIIEIDREVRAYVKQR